MNVAPVPNSERTPLAVEVRLHQAAQDFEALLLVSLWKPAQEGSWGEPQGMEDGGLGRETVADLSLQALAGAVAARGGLGIGTLLLKALKGAPSG